MIYYVLNLAELIYSSGEIQLLFASLFHPNSCSLGIILHFISRIIARENVSVIAVAMIRPP